MPCLAQLIDVDKFYPSMALHQLLCQPVVQNNAAHAQLFVVHLGKWTTNYAVGKGGRCGAPAPIWQERSHTSLLVWGPWNARSLATW